MNKNQVVIVTVTALVFALLTGYVAYNAGVERGIEKSAKIVAAPAPGGNVTYAYPYPYYGHRPWGGGWFFMPFLLIFFVWMLARGFHRHGRYHCGHDGAPSKP